MTAKKKSSVPGPDAAQAESSDLYVRIREILDSARANVARTVNTTQVVVNWLIGREIVEDLQDGASRAKYGRAVLSGVSAKLKADFGGGYSVDNLEWFRSFYLTYPELLQTENSDSVRRNFKTGSKSDAVHRISPTDTAAMLALTLRDQSWSPGQLHPNLSWTHYRTLIRTSYQDARNFYEIEAIKHNWSARELSRQINSLLFERLAKSRDKIGLMDLATKGQEVTAPADVFKDPVVIEFLGLPESHKLVESELEQALIANLQAFLLELGKGFAFISRQDRLTLDGDHFYVDLVFYHAILKCYVLVDLKVGKLTHGDLGQMQLYVNYFDQERTTEGDNPTLGLILCTDKNDAVVKYLLGPDQASTIFTSRYQLHLPSEAELASEIQRELQELQ